MGSGDGDLLIDEPRLVAVVMSAFPRISQRQVARTLRTQSVFAPNEMMKVIQVGMIAKRNRTLLPVFRPRCVSTAHIGKKRCRAIGGDAV